MEDLDRLAAAIRARPVSCGPVRLIAVDGHAGSGKSTFSAKLAEALGVRPYSIWTISPPTRSCSTGPGGCTRR